LKINRLHEDDSAVTGLGTGFAEVRRLVEF
jgi:hypothetical protein